MITYLLTRVCIDLIKLYDCILTYKSIYSIFIPNEDKKIHIKRSVYECIYANSVLYKHLQKTKLTDLNMNIIIKSKI